MTTNNRVLAWHVASDIEDLTMAARMLTDDEISVVSGSDGVIVNSLDGCSTMTVFGAGNNGPRQWDELDA